MIAKAITRTTKGQGFGGLARYMANERKMAAVPGGWGATAAYIADEGRSGAKVAPGSVRLTNCASETLGEAVREIELTQAQARQGKAEKTYHLVVAFPAGEVPTREQLEDIEDELVKAIGLADHQRMSAIHTDKDHLHFHVAINKVHPETFRTVTPHQDKNKLMRACAQLEVKHGLTRTHGERVQGGDGEAPEGRVADMEAHSGQESLLRFARETAKADLLASSTAGKGWQDLHDAAAAHGLEVRQRGAGVVFGVPGKPKLSVKASDVDRELSAKALTGRLGPFQVDARAAERPQPAKGYERRPKERDPAVDELVARYKGEREERQKARVAGLDEVRARHTSYRAELRQEGADRRRHAREFGTTPRRREVDREERKARMRQSIDGGGRAGGNPQAEPDAHLVWLPARRGGGRQREGAPAAAPGGAAPRRDRGQPLAGGGPVRGPSHHHEGDRQAGLEGRDGELPDPGRRHGAGPQARRRRGRGDGQLGAAGADRGGRAVRPAVEGAGHRRVQAGGGGRGGVPGVNVRFEDPAMEAMRAEAVQEREEARKRGPDKPTFLIVPFKDKDEVRTRGAEWDRERKEWFVPAGIDPERMGLAEWVPGNGRFSNERTYLNVPPFGANNQARGRGANFDAERKQWFVGPGHDLDRVRQWVPRDVPTSRARPIPSAAAAYAAGRNQVGAMMSAILPHRAWTAADAGEGICRGAVTLPDGGPGLLVERQDKMLVVALDLDQAQAAAELADGQAVHLGSDGVPQVRQEQHQGGRGGRR